MGYILMQPANDDVSRKATVKLLESGDCLFDLKKLGARLQAVFYDSRCCTDLEKQYNCFLREGSCGQWDISKNRKYL